MVNILFSMYNFGDEWAKSSVKEYINEKSRVCIVPFSFSDEWIHNSDEYHEAYDKNGGKYYDDMVQPFLSLGVSEENIAILNYYEDTNEKMQEIVNKSDVVFLTGGFPDRAVERVNEKGLAEVISKCNVVIGSSAGALMQFKDYYLSPDDDYPKFNYYKGIDLIDDDFYIEVHYENTDVQNECIKKVLNEKTHKIYAISNNGGIIIDNGKMELLGKVDVFKR